MLSSVSNYTMVRRDIQVKTALQESRILVQDLITNLEYFGIIVRLILLWIFCMQEISTVANVSQPALGGYVKVSFVNFLHLPFFILRLPKFWTLNKIVNLFLMRCACSALNLKITMRCHTWYMLLCWIGAFWTVDAESTHQEQFCRCASIL